MLQPEQYQIRDLVMGRGTPYTVSDFDPFELQTRPDGEAPRPMNHGSTSGGEFAAARMVTMTVVVEAQDRATWRPLHHKLAQAFKPVGFSGDVTLRWMDHDGEEFLVAGRPRMSKPDPQNLSVGVGTTQCAFLALDPLIYSGVEVVETVGLQRIVGGLTIGMAVPVVIPGTPASGVATLTNEGTEEAGLLLTITGPAVTPRLILLRPDGVVQQLRMLDTIPAGEQLIIDTKSRQVTMGGATRRGFVVGDFPILPAMSTSVLRFLGDYNPTASLQIRYRHPTW